MITAILKLSEIKKDPTCLLGWDRPAAVTKYGDIVAYVISPSRMIELLEAEETAKDRLKTLQMIHEGKLDAGDLINLYEVSK